jgi:hypothetical protein
MEVVDEEGRLFGLVNVVDALVVLFVVALAVAGVALVLGGEDATGESRHVTLDFGTQPQYVADRISVGDTARPSGAGNMTVTDLYVSPAEEGTRVVAQASLEGRATSEGFRYGGEPLRFGRVVPFQMETYTANGTISGVDGSAVLNASSERVVVAGNVSAETSRAIEAGDAYRVAGRSVATVESVTVYGTDTPDEKRVFVGLSLETVQVDGRQVFGPGREVREGMQIPFRTDEYEFAGEIVRVGATEQRGTATTRTVTLELENVRPDRADDVESGMTETAGDRVLARLTDVQTEPATLIVESDDGQVFERDHPVNEDVTMTAELTVRETPTGLRFKGRPLQLGDRVTLVVGSTTVRASVTSFDG